MRAFEVQLNGKRLCLAGVGERGVLTAIIEHIAGLNGSNLNLNVGGLFGSTWKHVRLDREADEKKQKAYVRAMAEKVGWRIDTGAAR